MEKVAVQSTKAVISVKRGKIERKLLLTGPLYKIVYEVSTGSNLTLNDRWDIQGSL